MKNLPISAAAAIFAAALLIALCPAAMAGNDPFADLKTRLTDSGLSAELVIDAFSPAPQADFKAVARTMAIRESKLDYGQFLQPGPIADAHAFLEKYQTYFNSAEAIHEVDRHVIAAILLVETQLGVYTGKTGTLSALATFAIMDKAKNRDEVWKRLSKPDRERWTRERFDAKLEKRAEWAWVEIINLFHIDEITAAGIKGMKGSVMGAVGWPQFLPSSINKHAADGGGDGQIDLYTPADAIHSVANYLKNYGWKNDLSREEKEKVIWEYNHSTPYVNTILDAADKLKELEGKKEG